MSPVLDGGGPSGLPVPPSGLSATQEILLLADNQLQDQTGVKWGPDRLIPYLNLGILEIINLKPEAYPTTVPITLVAGPTQNLPAGAIGLIDVVCNLDATGVIPQSVIRSVDKTAMDHLIPGWMTFTATAVVSYAILDPRDPHKFYVFPPATGGNKVQAVISTPPGALADSDSTFPLDDSYRPAAVDYLIYRALAEETSQPNALAKSKDFYQAFLRDLGVKSASEQKQAVKGA